MFAITMAGFELTQNDRLFVWEEVVGGDKVDVEVNRTEPNCYKWIIVQRFFSDSFVFNEEQGR